MKSVTICAGCLMALSLFVASPSLYAQYLGDGAAVSTAPSGQWVEDLTMDGASGAIFAWEDWRGTSIDIYAQRVDEWGYAQWAADGIVVCGASGQQQYPRVIPDGSGGAVFVWSDTRSGSYVVYAQHIDGTGNALWAADGVPLATADGWQQYPVPVPDGTGGTIVFWQAGIGSSANIYAQRIDADGAVQWAAAGNAVCTAAGLQTSIHAIPDGAGGAVAVWNDRRAGTDDIYAQRIDMDGNARWPANGVAICSAVQAQSSGGIVEDGARGAIIAWTDFRNGTSWEVYAQRIDSMGNAQWTADGEYVPTRPGDASDLGVASNGAGGAYIAWVAAGASDSLFAGHIDGSGSVLWTVPLSPANTASVSRPAPDGTGGAIISWETSGDIYGQKVDAGGVVLWPEGGVAICTAPDAQQYPVITPDGAGGLVAAWWDFRNSGGSAFEGDVYAGRVAANGDIVATMLESFTVFVDGNAVVVQWTLSTTGGESDFLVLRAEHPGGSYAPLIDAQTERIGLSFRLTDRSCRPGGVYRYRVDVADEDGRSILFETDAVTVPAAAVILYQNHPNPFNPSTTIAYVVPDDARVILEIFDVEGKPVIRLVDAHQKQGRYSVRWNGVDRSGKHVATGVYLYRLTAGKHTISRKMVLMK